MRAFGRTSSGEEDAGSGAGWEVYITNQLCKAIARGGLRARRLLPFANAVTGRPCTIMRIIGSCREKRLPRPAEPAEGPEATQTTPAVPLVAPQPLYLLHGLRVRAKTWPVVDYSGWNPHAT